MKQYLVRSLASIACALTLFGTDALARVRIRSQSVDSARELAGWTHKINLFEQGNYFTFAVTPEYTQSFDAKRIGQSLFNMPLPQDTVCDSSCSDTTACDCDVLTFEVRGGISNTTTNFIGENLGLPGNYGSTVSIKPKIKNFLVDFDFYWGLDDVLCGLWFRLHAPVVYAKWSIDIYETDLPRDLPLTGYPVGYFAPGAVPATNLLSSFEEYLTGQAPILNGGVVYQGLANQRLASNGDCYSSPDCPGSTYALDKTALSDIQAVLGWNFCQNEDYHFGLGLRVAAPTGTRINDTFLFAPQIGNGHHWEVGGMITSHWTFWRDCDDRHSLGVYLDANITHMFKTTQCRVFDLCQQGPNSRFLLAQQMGLPVEYGLTGNPMAATATPIDGFTAPNQVFQDLFFPVANISMIPVQVSIPVQADFTLLFNYHNACGFEWDLGYNYWSTSCEKIHPCSSGNSLFADNNSIGLKGFASVYGFAASSTSPETFVSVPLSSTDSNAVTLESTLVDPIDNPQYAYAATASGTVPVLTSPGELPQAITSIQPVLLTADDVNYNSSRVRGKSHKVFTHFGYTWLDCECLTPYLGVGGKAEFASHYRVCDSIVNTDCEIQCDTSCSPCNSGAVSEWGIWLKGGVSF